MDVDAFVNFSTLTEMKSIRVAGCGFSGLGLSYLLANKVPFLLCGRLELSVATLLTKYLS
jgi:hypothetical protein